MTFTTRVLRFRLKDKHAEVLWELAREVNFVWNYVNELSVKVWQCERRFLSGYDFYPFTKGVGKAGSKLHSQTIQAIGAEYAVRRKRARTTKLRWRVSSSTFLKALKRRVANFFSLSDQVCSTSRSTVGTPLLSLKNVYEGRSREVLPYRNGRSWLQHFDNLDLDFVLQRK